MIYLREESTGDMFYVCINCGTIWELTNLIKEAGSIVNAKRFMEEGDDCPDCLVPSWLDDLTDDTPALEALDGID